MRLSEQYMLAGILEGARVIWFIPLLSAINSPNFKTEDYTKVIFCKIISVIEKLGFDKIAENIVLKIGKQTSK